MFSKKKNPAGIIHKATKLVKRKSKNDQPYEPQSLEDELKSYSNNVSIMYMKATALLNKNQYYDAITCFDAILRIDSNDTDVYNSKAYAQVKLGYIESALENYQKIIELDPKYPGVYGNIGVVYYNLKQYNKSMSALEIAIKINPNDSKALFHKGILLDKLERREEALNCFETICMNDPSHADALLWKGLMLLMFDKNEQAFGVFDILLTRYVNDSLVESEFCRKFGIFDKLLSKQIELFEAARKNSDTSKTIQKYLQGLINEMTVKGNIPNAKRTTQENTNLPKTDKTSGDYLKSMLKVTALASAGFIGGYAAGSAIGDKMFKDAKSIRRE